MLRIAFVLLLAVELGGGFGTASAEITAVSDESMNIDIEVEVTVSASAVVAHLIAPGEPQLTLPLLSRGDGVFGIQTDLRIIDYQVVFEAVGDPSVESQPVSLTELGAEFPGGSFSPTTTETDEISAGTRRWGWLGLGLAAASLSALAFWVLGARDEASETEEPEVEDSKSGHDPDS